MLYYNMNTVHMCYLCVYYAFIIFFIFSSDFVCNYLQVTLVPIVEKTFVIKHTIKFFFSCRIFLEISKLLHPLTKNK